jgi:hypothetical protein
MKDEDPAVAGPSVQLVLWPPEVPPVDGDESPKGCA